LLGIFSDAKYQAKQEEIKLSKLRAELEESLKSFAEIPQLTYHTTAVSSLTGVSARSAKGVGKELPLRSRHHTANSRKDLQMFLGEARVMHKMNHPNCVRMYGVSYSQTEQSFVIEWLNGGDLADCIEKQPCPPMHKRISL